MSKRILVIEDQEDNRQILRDLLTSANFEVIEAEDGEAGLTAAAAHRPDLILMDMQLPILDGYEATRRLKADAALHAIPVIAVTSYASNIAGAESLYSLEGNMCGTAMRGADALPGSKATSRAKGSYRKLGPNSKTICAALSFPRLVSTVDGS